MKKKTGSNFLFINILNETNLNFDYWGLNWLKNNLIQILIIKDSLKDWK